MRKIQRWYADFFPQDIIPHVHLRPVTDWKCPKMFSLETFSVQNIPKFRTLVFGIPLPELIPMGEETLLSPSLFFVPPTTTDCAINLMRLDGIEQGGDL